MKKNIFTIMILAVALLVIAPTSTKASAAGKTQKVGDKELTIGVGTMHDFKLTEVEYGYFLDKYLGKGYLVRELKLDKAIENYNGDGHVYYRYYFDVEQHPYSHWSDEEEAWVQSKEEANRQGNDYAGGRNRTMDIIQYGEKFEIVLRDDTIIKDGRIWEGTSYSFSNEKDPSWRSGEIDGLWIDYMPNDNGYTYEVTTIYKNGKIAYMTGYDEGRWFEIDNTKSHTYYFLTKVSNSVIEHSIGGTEHLAAYLEKEGFIVDGNWTHNDFNSDQNGITWFDGDKLFRIKDANTAIDNYESTVKAYKKACKKLPKYSKIKKNAAKYNGKSYKVTATVVGSTGFGSTSFLHVTTKSGDFIVATNEMFTDWDNKTHKYQAGDKVTVYFTVTGYGTLNDAGYGNLKFTRAYQKATKQNPNLWILPEDNSQYTPSQSVVFGIAKTIEKKSK